VKFFNHGVYDIFPGSKLFKRKNILASQEEANICYTPSAPAIDMLLPISLPTYKIDRNKTLLDKNCRW